MLDLSWIPIICIICFGIFYGLFIFYRLLSIDPEQTINQKIIVLYNNTVRLLNFILNPCLLLGKYCDICLKKTQKDEAFVLWHDKGNSKKHPYLNPPHRFFVGHERCLYKQLEFQIKDEGNFKIKEKIKENYHIKNGSSFLIDHFKIYKEWFKSYGNHWTKVRSDYLSPSRKEIEFDKAVGKIKKINK